MNRERRLVVMAGFAATAGLAIQPVSGQQTDSSVPIGGALPRPPLDVEIRFDEAARAAAADDFGHLVHETPEAVVLPASARDVATTVRWAAEHGRQCAPQAQRHSVFGRSQIRNGIVIDMSPLRAVHSVQSDRIVVEAGATWSDVLAVTLPQGLTPPVLTDYVGRCVTPKRKFHPNHILAPGYDVLTRHPIHHDEGVL